MNWRWISLAAALAALAIGYSVFNDRRAAPAPSSAPPPQPGYYLNDAIITQTQKDGSLGVRLIADRIKQLPAEDGIELNNVRMNYFRAPKEWILTARRGRVPADSRVVEFTGNVQLRPSDQPNAFLRTDALALDAERNLAHGREAPVSLTFGPHTVVVQDFTADLNTEKLRMEAVHGAYQSR
ncbi:MAG TPA: LPS export ABC transporter periplasmic protein LptC [Steroidobacter sp.]|nr:LPS export ABC transporter periplasmic protein LptC [Steroidobacter sp.]